MLIFLYGDDNLRVKERALDLKRKFLEKFDPAGMNVDEILVRDAAPELGHVFQAVQAAPFLSEKRLVIIRGLLEALKKPESKKWIEGFTKTPASTVVVFADSLTSAEFEKKELWKALSTLPDVHKYPLPRLDGSELSTWAKERVLKHGLTITPTILEDIIARTNKDAWRIDAELQKLAAYANGDVVTLQMVDLLVRADVEADIFALMDALSASPSKALKKLTNEREAGADEFQLFGMLLRQLRLIIQVRAVIDVNARANKQDVATALGVHPFVAQKMLDEARGWSMVELKKVHVLAQKLDKSMKSGIKPEIAVDRLVSEWLVK